LVPAVIMDARNKPAPDPDPGCGHDRGGRRFDLRTQMVCVICITDQQKVDDILDAVHGLLACQIGIVSISDVEVIRQEHF
jgi:hypothetical protein